MKIGTLCEFESLDYKFFNYIVIVMKKNEHHGNLWQVFYFECDGGVKLISLAQREFIELK